MSDMQEAKRLLTLLEKAVMDFFEAHQVVKTISDDDRGTQQKLDDALDEVRERLADWPTLKSLDVGHGRMIQGSPYVIDDVKRRLESIPVIEQAADKATVLHEDATRRVEHVERQNDAMRSDLATMRGYVMRLVDERTPHPIRLPQLNVDRMDDESCRVGYSDLMNYGGRPY